MFVPRLAIHTATGELAVCIASVNGSQASRAFTCAPAVHRKQMGP